MKSTPHLAYGGDRALFTAVDDPCNRSPDLVVAASYDQDIVIAQHHSGHCREPQGRMANVLAEGEHKIGDWHAAKR